MYNCFKREWRYKPSLIIEIYYIVYRKYEYFLTYAMNKIKLIKLKIIIFNLPKNNKIK